VFIVIFACVCISYMDYFYFLITFCSLPWFFVFFWCWTLPARGRMRFLGGGPFLRVEFCDSWAMDPSRAWKFVIPERWTIPARGIARFLGDGRFPHVGVRDSWPLDNSWAWYSMIPE